MHSQMKHKKVNDKPVIPVRLKEFIYVRYEESGKNSRADNGGNRSHNYIGQSDLEGQQQPENK